MIEKIKTMYREDFEGLVVATFIGLCCVPLLIVAYASAVAIFLDVIGMSVGACL